MFKIEFNLSISISAKSLNNHLWNLNVFNQFWENKKWKLNDALLLKFQRNWPNFILYITCYITLISLHFHLCRNLSKNITFLTMTLYIMVCHDLNQLNRSYIFLFKKKSWFSDESVSINYELVRRNKSIPTIMVLQKKQGAIFIIYKEKKITNSCRAEWNERNWSVK